MKKHSRSLLLHVSLLPLLLLGCNRDSTDSEKSPIAPYIVFDDDAESNVDPEQDTFDLKFLDPSGNEVRLADYRGRKNVVLVVTRGYNGYFCQYCNAQTSRLIHNYDQFESRNTEVIVVYPGEAAKADEFIDKVRNALKRETADFPLSIVLDEDLAAVKQLMIVGDIAKPSTYILDIEGNVRFAYVGRTRTDRPSLKAILAKLDEINEP